jgi:lipoprotein-anchoring transpeptidase ErfK/SrfK
VVKRSLALLAATTFVFAAPILWYPLHFLRGFALHGYPSVPAYPASHGCVRLPMWFARGFHARWRYGATVRIFA